MLKTVEMIDFRMNHHALLPLRIMGSTVAAVESFKFLGTTISQDLKWDTHNNSIVKKAQQRLNFLRQLKKLNLPQVQITQCYSADIESVLCSSITVWFGSACKSIIRRLQWTVRTAERIIGVHLPNFQDLYNSRMKKRAGNIITDPSHNLFALLPSGRPYRSLCTRTSSHKNSPQCHLKPKQLTQLVVFCNSFSISNYCLSLYVNMHIFYTAVCI